MRLPSQLLRRNPDVHKGDFGHIFVLAGSARFSGAAVLCAEAAMRSGAGLVTLAVPESLTSAIIKIKTKEVMLLPLPETKEGTFSLAGYRKIKGFIGEVNVLVIGPGLSRHKATKGLVRRIVSNTDKTLVIDADGLNAFAGYLNLLKAVCCRLQADVIFTPHPGEMARLLRVSIRKVQGNRKKFALEFAKKYNATLVLKGYQTVVADYKENFYINMTGNPGMATAGSGDVLTGIIAAFLGQGLDAFAAAKYAVYLHGLAGDLAAEERTQISLIASDIIAKIPEAIKRCS